MSDDATNGPPGPPRGLSLSDRELADRLGWFTQIRWVMGATAMIALLAAWEFFDIRFRRDDGQAVFTPAIWAVALIFVYNAAFALLVRFARRRGRLDRRRIVELALGQLICDMIAICAVAHFTGGVENFFVVLIILPLVIATELLPTVLAYATAGGAAALVNILAWSEQRGWLSHVYVDWPGKPAAAGEYPHADPFYVMQVTASLTVTILLIVVVAAEISRRLRRRESELETAYNRLAAADEAKSFFMRKAGHELRAPLAAIHSLLEAVVETSDALESDHRKLIRRTQHRTTAMMALVDDLRRYSFLRRPAGATRHEELSLSNLVAGAAELFGPQAAEKGIELRTDIDPVRLVGDEEMLREAVTNLVANAIQYTGDGGHVDVTLRREGEAALLSVSDSGIGLTEAAKEMLFKEFYRSPEARKLQPEGTGLGLAITRQIARMHGGSLAFESEAGQGTTFTIRLPIEAE